MILAYLLIAMQLPDPVVDVLEPRVPGSAELRAAERRDERRFATIVRVCREAGRTADPVPAIRRFADANGLSSYGRLALLLDCRLYRQGVRDGARGSGQ